MLKYNGKYYFVATRDAGGQTVLNIRVADMIDGIATATDNEIYSNGTALIWAPEIHNIDGKLMISLPQAMSESCTISCNGAG